MIAVLSRSDMKVIYVYAIAVKVLEEVNTLSIELIPSMPRFVTDLTGDPKCKTAFSH